MCSVFPFQDVADKHQVTKGDLCLCGEAKSPITIEATPATANLYLEPEVAK